MVRYGDTADSCMDFLLLSPSVHLSFLPLVDGLVMLNYSPRCECTDFLLTLCSWIHTNPD